MPLSPSHKEEFDEVRRQAETRGQAWGELGASAPAMEDDLLAPPVDRALLAQLIRGELAPPTAASVNRLVLSFGNWRDAHAEVAAEEFRTAPPAV